MLLMALSAPMVFDLLGIVTVAGNVPLAKTQRNARIICDLAGRTDIKVYAGNDRPICRPLERAEQVHGREGLNGVDVHDPVTPLQKKHGVDFIIDVLLAAPDGEVVLVPTGPLTNIAQAISRAPEILPKIQKIVLMGGARREGGNVTASAEYNIYVDPHAAEIVFGCGRPIIAMGLDVTHQVVSSPDILARLASFTSPAGKAAHALLRHYEFFDAEKYGGNGAPLHDPCTIAYLFDPSLFELKACNIEIETQSALTMGHTAVDFWNATGKPVNAHWVFKADRPRFFDLFIERIQTYETVGARQ